MTAKLRKMIETEKYKQHGFDGLTIDERSEFLLAYVAVSRSRFKLENANFLEWTADIEFDGEEDEFERNMHNNMLDF